MNKEKTTHFAVALALVVMTMTACAEVPVTSAAQHPYFRTCRAEYGFGNRRAAMLEVYGTRAALFVGDSDGVPTEKLNRATLRHWATIDDVYKDSPLQRTDTSMRFRVTPNGQGFDGVQEESTGIFVYSIHWPFHFECEDESKKNGTP